MTFEQSLHTILGLNSYLTLNQYQLSIESRQLILYISHNSNCTFACPVCDKKDIPIVRTENHQLRYLNFFQFQTLIFTYRICCKCPIHGEQRIHTHGKLKYRNTHILFVNSQCTKVIQ